MSVLRLFGGSFLSLFLLFQKNQQYRIMLASVTRRRVVSRARFLVIRAKSTSVDPKVGGPLGDDGRHELWREGIYDHDNEPK